MPYTSSFRHTIPRETVLLLLYADDMIMTRNNMPEILELENKLSRQFDMKSLET